MELDEETNMCDASGPQSDRFGAKIHIAATKIHIA